MRPRRGRVSAAKNWRTPARADVMRKGWASGVAAVVLCKEMAALEGPPLPIGVDLAMWANKLGLKRPPGFRGHTANRAATQPPPPRRLSENERLERARELVRRGLNVRDAAQFLRLTASEAASLAPARG
jgi:hypothetical protein